MEYRIRGYSNSAEKIYLVRGFVFIGLVGARHLSDSGYRRLNEKRKKC